MHWRPERHDFLKWCPRSRGLVSDLTALQHQLFVACIRTSFPSEIFTTVSCDPRSHIRLCATISSRMDQAQGWNFDDHCLFFADGSFSLLGDYNPNFDFNDELAPGFDEANNAFDLNEWHEPPAAVDSLHSDFHFQLPTLQEPEEVSCVAPAELYEPIHEQNSSPSSKDHEARAGSPPSGNEDEVHLTTSATKRKFLTVFSANSGKDVPLRARKRFSEERKKAVALNRTIGVCLHCRLRKVAVS